MPVVAMTSVPTDMMALASAVDSTDADSTFEYVRMPTASPATSTRTEATNRPSTHQRSPV